ncbi:TetR/AcrR family transcriptional regulator [Pseudorhodobacter sp.]|uniref:TetR/AcrR family transcriptional regulator n=1 Tax=Pseudorhodobacter sp. TaxID=1934400 RepID=UPI002649975D|nr:TetR/AcrR family transcriptional regulator [Pseudorhodobacter sp.]MDN5786653.1 TetR/AcrR family transcriptional regulator [Pseudorhodobacter sp.]
MPERKRQRRKDARPEEILTAALQEFGEKGFASASMGSIATRAGIARTTIYLYYDSKDAIFEAALLDRLGGMIASATDLLAIDAPFATVLERVLRTYYDRIVGTDAAVLLRVMIAESGRFPALSVFLRDNMLASVEALLTRLISIGIQRGEVRAEVAALDLNVVLAPAVFAVVFGLMFGETAPLDKERYIRSHLQIILNGLRG